MLNSIGNKIFFVWDVGVGDTSSLMRELTAVSLDLTLF